MPLAQIAFTENRKVMNFVTSYSGRYVYNNDNKNTDYNHLCSGHIDGTIRSFFVKMLIMTFFCVVSQVWPVYKSFTDGTRTTLTEVKFPFITEDSDAEYTGNLIFQAIVLTIGGMVLISFEVALHLADSLSSIVPKYIGYYLGKFRMDIADKRTTKAQLCFTFKNICKEALYSDLYVS